MSAARRESNSAAFPASDQAAGLRKLLENRPTQVIAFAGGGRSSGRTSLAVECARSLATMQHRVILLDENDSASNALAMLGVSPQGDLLDALLIGKPLAQLVGKVAPGLWAGLAAKAAAMLRFDSPKANEVAATLMTPMESAANFVLIDSQVLEDGHLSLLSAQAHHMIVVISAQADAITRAYALIKRLVKERGRSGFYLAITRAESETEAAKIYDNVRATAKRHLGVSVEYFGNFTFPLSHTIGHALLAKLPMANQGAEQRYAGTQKGGTQGGNR